MRRQPEPAQIAATESGSSGFQSVGFSSDSAVVVEIPLRPTCLPSAASSATKPASRAARSEVIDMFLEKHARSSSAPRFDALVRASHAAEPEGHALDVNAAFGPHALRWPWKRLAGDYLCPVALDQARLSSRDPCRRQEPRPQRKRSAAARPFPPPLWVGCGLGIVLASTVRPPTQMPPG